VQKNSRKLAVAIGVSVAIVCVAAGVLLAVRWPFTENRMVQGLQRMLDSDVRCGRYRMTFFPSPGGDLENVSIVRGRATLAQVRHLEIRSTWPNLLTLTHRLSRVRIEGLSVHIARPLPSPVDHGPPQHKTIASEIVADGAVLEIKRDGSPNDPLRLQFRELLVRNAGAGQKISVRTRLRSSEPPDDLELHAEVGPFDSANRSRTPLSGSFAMTHADLSHYPGIGGLLNATGEFQGQLGRLSVAGKTDCDDFIVRSSEHTQAIHANFRAVVDALHGNLVLDNVDGQFGDTHVVASGEISGDQGKTTTVHFQSDHSDVRDLLHMFSRAPVPALSGPITFDAKAVVPPEHGRFVQKLQLTGEFAIAHARFSNPTTRVKVNQLSARARKEAPNNEKNDADDAANIVSEIRSSVVMRDGVARLSQISFHVPGATARGSGYYNLVSKRINIHGQVAMESSLSQASGGGLKSVLLKPFNGLFRQKNSKAGAVLPVSVAGIYPHPQFHVSLKPGANKDKDSSAHGQTHRTTSTPKRSVVSEE
jgi:hypothetical protein